jgi:hypothetical protein
MLVRFVCIVAILCHVAGCSTMRLVDSGQAIPAVGDHVRLSLHSGREVSFDVVRVDEARVCGAAECVALAEVREWRRMEVSAWLTTLLVVGILASLFAIMSAAGPAIAMSAM